MITTIRKSFKTKAYKIVLWITLLAVGGVFSVVEMMRGYLGGGKNWVLQINKETIYMPEYARSVADQDERLRMLRAQYGQYAELYFQMMGMTANPKELAIDSLIRKSLLNQSATKLGFMPSQQAIDEKFGDIMFLYQELSDIVPLYAWDQTLQAVNMVILRNHLARIGLSTLDLDQHIAQALKRQALMHIIGLSSYVPDFEIKERIIREYAPHQFSLLTISGADILNQVKNEPVSDEQLKTFFDMKNNNERRYFVPEKRTANVVTFAPSEYGIHVAPEEIETYYQSQKAKYVEKPAQVQVKRVVFADEQKALKAAEELKKNPSYFAELSSELVPFFSKGQKEQVFERAAFVLAKEGDVSPIVKTKDGFEILQLVSKKPQQFKPVSHVSAEIQKHLLKRKFEEQFSADMRKLSQANESAIQEFIKKKNAKVKTVHEQANDSSTLAKTMFRLTKSENTSYLDGENGVFVTLTDVKESYSPAFETVKNQVKHDYWQDQAARTLKKRLEELKGTARNNSLQDIKEAGNVRQFGWVNKQDAAKSPDYADLTKKGISIEAIFQSENIGAVNSFEHDGNGYLVRLDGIKELSAQALQEKRLQTASQMSREQNNLVSAGFIASLYRNAIITKNESQLQLAS